MNFMLMTLFAGGYDNNGEEKVIELCAPLPDISNEAELQITKDNDGN